MSDLNWRSDAQMAKLKPFFPKSHGKPRVDDKRGLSGIIFINSNGFVGVMPLRSMGRIRRSTAVGSDGAIRVSSPGCFSNWPIKAAGLTR